MPKMTPEERAKAQIGLFVTQEFADKNPAIIKKMMERMMEQLTPTRGAIRQQQVSQAAIADDILYKRLPEIKAPTLVIHGDADKAVPVENARILASRIPNAELLILKKAGHLLIEAEDAKNRIMLDFLQRHRSSS